MILGFSLFSVLSLYETEWEGGPEEIGQRHAKRELMRGTTLRRLSAVNVSVSMPPSLSLFYCFDFTHLLSCLTLSSHSRTHFLCVVGNNGRTSVCERTSNSSSISENAKLPCKSIYTLTTTQSLIHSFAHTITYSLCNSFQTLYYLLTLSHCHFFLLLTCSRSL